MLFLATRVFGSPFWFWSREMLFNPVDVIITKREKGTLASQDIQRLIEAYTKGEVYDYQMSAFLMASFLNGLDGDETAALTHAMLHSGTVLDLSEIPGIKVDKHSTGGVGDKISLILAPIVASCGVPVPMISGRGLGHSGGTLDKLESIPGFNVILDIPSYRDQLAALGIVMIGQTAEIAPADRKLYALRDVTGTVECIPLIASSIMSKKLAEGIDALVLDVKCGQGAFMKNEEDAIRLAETLIDLGVSFGKSVVAWITAMEQPLGHAVGNWVEVAESIRCLQGESIEDVMQLTYTLASEMIVLGGVAADLDSARLMAIEAVATGRAFEMFVRLVEAQGGDVDAVVNPDQSPKATTVHECYAQEEHEGFVAALNAYEIGKAALYLGAGRMSKEATVDPTAGIVIEKKVGDSVRKGDLLATLYTSREVDVEWVSQKIGEAYTFSPTSTVQETLLIKRYASS